MPADPANTQSFGGHTSRIVGLFLNRYVALTQFKHISLKPLDPRLVEFTKATLKRIGRDHPVFKIGTDIAHLMEK